MHRHGNQLVHRAVALALFGWLSVISICAQNSDSDWKGVEEALGRSRQVQPGDVMKFSMPRKDLHISLSGTEIKPGLALGSWVAFKCHKSQAMVMGDRFASLPAGILESQHKRFAPRRLS